MTSTDTNERTVLRMLSVLMDDYVQNLEMQWCGLFHLHSKLILLGHYEVQMNFYIRTPLISKFALFVNFINDIKLNKYQTISEVILRCTGHS
jgi:hypothetical protein